MIPLYVQKLLEFLQKRRMNVWKVIHVMIRQYLEKTSGKINSNHVLTVHIGTSVIIIKLPTHSLAETQQYIGCAMALKNKI